MKHNFRRLTLPLLSFGILLSAMTAQAQLLISLVPSQIGAISIGGSISFSGTITNTNVSNTYFLNGDQVLLLTGTNIGGFSIDDSPFFLGAPLSLAPNDSYTGSLFKVTAPPVYLNSNYTGSFTILGGTGAFDNDPIGARSFNFRVVPEPGSAAFLAVSLIAAAGLFLRRRALAR